ncbi:MAG TPA: FxSxx-COOH system tetratricopeptide repeat protein, partial [Ktedonosporobacter sp.]|nr:FxSxx-COOH system tetratricopeptide repeat protein [Ktedonosporobacter sp.]
MTVTADDFSFGTLLKMFRQRQRLMQQALAEALGVHRRTLVRWEQGDYLPESKALVLEMARHLKLDGQETRQLLEASLTALTPHWSVPFPRNPYFTGREEVLETLHTQLGVDQAMALTQSSALHGLGGVGKTQIALEYAYRHALEYRAVFWIGAETEEQIVSSLLRIAEVLQLPGREDKGQQRVVAAVQRWLSVHGQWLLIWDNVEDLDLLQRFLPSTRSGAMLLTTRNQAPGTLARGMDLSPMEQEEGMLFLLRRAKVLEPDAASQQMGQFALQMPHQYAAAAELVEVMGVLPLALDQAGAYIEATQCGLQAYLNLFHARRAVLLTLRGEGSRDHPASVSTTFTIALSATAQRHPAVMDFLHACALLQPDAIPEEFFSQGGKHLGPTLEGACRDRLEWDRVVGMACSYSLLSRQPEEQTLSIHRLVQAVLLDAMTDEEREKWSARVIAILDVELPEVRHATKYAAWKQCERLLPHALLRVQRAEATSESLPLASLAYKTAHYLLRRGRYSEVEPLVRRALQIYEQALGPKHPEVATSLNTLAILSLYQGQHAQAEPLSRRALQIREQALGPKHPEVAASLNTLAILYAYRGQYTQAEPLVRRALQIYEQALGPEHPEVAGLLSNLAILYSHQGQYAQAEPLVRRALQIHEQALGPEHPEVADSLQVLANLCREQGKYPEAKQLYQRALQIREATGHPEAVEPLHGLANLYRDRSHYPQAERLYQRALQIHEQALGPEHPRVAILLTDLAECYHMQRRDGEAERLYQRALQIYEQALGPEHPEVAASLHGLANLLRDRCQYAEAGRLYRRARSIREQHLGQHHPLTA